MDQFNEESDIKSLAQPFPALEWLAQHAVYDDLPPDLSPEHDHYLYGTPKRTCP